MKKIELVLSNRQLDTLSDIQIDMMKEEFDNLRNPKGNTITIDTIYAFENVEGTIECNTYIRNSSEGLIKTGECVFDLVKRSTREVVSTTKQNILYQVKELKPFTGASLKVYFHNLNEETYSIDDLQVEFHDDINLQEEVNIEYNYRDFSENENLIESFNEFVGSLVPMTEGEVDFNVFSMGWKDTNLRLGVLIRNAKDREIKINKMPVIICDEEDNEILNVILDFTENDLYVSSKEGRVFDVLINDRHGELISKDLRKCEVYIGSN